VSRTRVVLAEVSPILDRILKDALEGQDDIEIVPDLPDKSFLASVLAYPHSYVVVLGRDLEEDEKNLWSGASGVSVVAVTNGGRAAFRYQLRPERAPIGDGKGVSSQALVDAIRGSARPAI